MSGIEIALLVIGIIVVVASFIFSAKGDPEIITGESPNLTEKQKEDIRKQITDVLSEQAETISEKTELSLDKLSTQKMQEMNEFSENILQEINRNHNEVMFLYDMLNEKKKEVNNTVRDLNVAKKEMEETAAAASDSVAASVKAANELQVAVADAQSSANSIDSDDAHPNMPSDSENTEEIILEEKEQETKKKTRKSKTRKTSADEPAAADSADAPGETAASDEMSAPEVLSKTADDMSDVAAAGTSDDITEPSGDKISIPDDEDFGFMAGAALIQEEEHMKDTMEQEEVPVPVVERKPRKKNASAKTAAARAKSAIKKESARNSSDPESFDTGNNNKKILDLHAGGMSNVDIAKELGIGIGEVKLVIDLFRGGK